MSSLENFPAALTKRDIGVCGEILTLKLFEQTLAGVNHNVVHLCCS